MQSSETTSFFLVSEWLNQKPGKEVHIRKDLCNFGEDVIRQVSFKSWKNHLKDVSVTPAALARPGGDGGEDTA